jgi:ribA/ribD-fused uncharacterized protein
VEVIRFNKVAEEHGWLGNMSPYPIEAFGDTWRTSEALFQALRFNDPTVREHIRSQKAPMGAKLAAKSAAKKHPEKMVVEPLSEIDLRNMRYCLNLKVDQHPELFDKLVATGDREIVEDCTSRANRGSAKFWGAAYIDSRWVGSNHLGKLWMEIRSQCQAKSLLSPVLLGLKNLGYDTHNVLCAKSGNRLHVGLGERSRSFPIDEDLERDVTDWLRRTFDDN